MSNKACHHIHQMKGFFHICFVRLTSMYTLVYQKKSTKVGLCPMRWPPLPKLPLPKLLGYESKSIWLTIKIRYSWNTKWVCYMYLHCMQHWTVIGFKIVRIFSLNTIETLSGPLCPPSPYTSDVLIWLRSLHSSTARTWDCSVQKSKAIYYKFSFIIEVREFEQIIKCVSHIYIAICTNYVFS